MFFYFGSMEKEAFVLYNRANEDKERYPRQIRTINAVDRGLKKRGFGVEKFAIDYHGDGTNQVLQNVIEQIRPHFDRLLGKKIVICKGDGGTCLILRSLTQLTEENGTYGLEAPFVAPAGTYNLLSKELGTSTVSDLLRAIDDESITCAQSILMRDMVVSTYKDERIKSDVCSAGEFEKTDEVTYPWTLFAGYGVDGRIIAQSEFAPRSRPNIVNALLITASMLKYISVPTDGMSKIDTYSAMTIPYYGPYRFDKSLSHLGDPSFQTITYHSDFGIEALEYFSVINGIGLSEKVNSKLWNFLGNTDLGKLLTEHSKLFRIAMEVSLEERNNLGFTIDPGRHYLHLDGYPLILDVEEGNFCAVNLESGERSIDVMRVSK